MRRALLTVAMVVVLATGAGPASALMRVVPFDDLAADAADVVEGTVLSTTGVWAADHSTIYTDVVVRVDDPIAGALKRNQEIRIRVEGGVVGDTRIWVEHQPVFRPAEHAVLFLRAAAGSAPRSVLHLEQGKFTIQRGRIVNFRGEGQAQAAFRSRVLALHPAPPK